MDELTPQIMQVIGRLKMKLKKTWVRSTLSRGGTPMYKAQLGNQMIKLCDFGVPGFNLPLTLPLLFFRTLGLATANDFTISK